MNTTTAVSFSALLSALLNNQEVPEGPSLVDEEGELPCTLSSIECLVEKLPQILTNLGCNRQNVELRPDGDCQQFSVSASGRTPDSAHQFVVSLNAALHSTGQSTLLYCVRVLA